MSLIQSFDYEDLKLWKTTTTQKKKKSKPPIPSYSFGERDRNKSRKIYGTEEGK